MKNLKGKIAFTLIEEKSNNQGFKKDE